MVYLVERVIEISECVIQVKSLFISRYIYTIFIERATNSGFWWREIDYPNKMFLQIQWR